MTLNTSKKDEILARREQVATMRLRGQTQREIAVTLSVCPATICHDLQALEAEWRARAAATTDEHKTRQYAELTEVKRAAWGKKELQHVLTALKQETQLLGTDAPTQSIITIDSHKQLMSDIGDVIATALDASGISADAREQIAQDIAAGLARLGAGG